MNISKKTVGIIGLLLAVAFIVAGFVIKVPDKYISYYSFEDNGYHEYVGGDAYNYIIEAGLRGGEIAGAKSAKAVCFAVASVLSLASLFMLAENGDVVKNEDVDSINAAEANEVITEIEEKSAEAENEETAENEGDLQ